MEALRPILLGEEVVCLSEEVCFLLEVSLVCFDQPVEPEGIVLVLFLKHVVLVSQEAENAGGVALVTEDVIVAPLVDDW